MKTKAELRAALFDSKNKVQAKRSITLFGEEVEIRQPTLAQITKLGRQTEDKVPPIIKIMVEYCYVPGTNEKVFEPADADALAEMPTGKWLTDLNTAIEELTGVDVKGAEKNSEETE